MEAPDRSDAVVLPASNQLSRPGPAFGCREGGFQNPATGEPRPKPSRRPRRTTAVNAINNLEIYYENA